MSVYIHDCMYLLIADIYITPIMNSSATNVALIGRFPFKYVVSKDKIPLPSTVADVYDTHAAANDEFVCTSLRNCCWIEVTMHMLLIDPFIRHFVIEFIKMDMCVPLVQVTLRADLNQLYLRGKIIMMILARRWQKASTPYVFRLQMLHLYQEYRHSCTVSQCVSIDQYGMGVVSSSLPDALSAITLFIATNWSSCSFQKQWLAYGHAPLTRSVSSCTNNACQSVGRDVSSSLADVDMIDNLDFHVVAATYIAVAYDESHELLEVLLSRHFKKKWSMTQESAGFLSSCPTCKETSMIYCSELMTLPWMLYVQVDRTNQRSAAQYSMRQPHSPDAFSSGFLEYDTEKLTLGPTVGGLYATYRLVGRIKYAHSHFNADLRVVNKEDKFVQWSFNQTRPVELNGRTCDTSCCCLVWQRIE